MNRPSFFARAAASIAGAVAAIKGGELERTIDRIFQNRTRYYRTYVMGQEAIYFDKELVASLKKENDLFAKMARRQVVPIDTGVHREFFQYKVTNGPSRIS